MNGDCFGVNEEFLDKHTQRSPRFDEYAYKHEEILEEKQKNSILDGKEQDYSDLQYEEQIKIKQYEK